MYSTDGCVLPNVGYLKVREVGLGDGFIDGLILLDSAEEIPLRVFG